MSSVYLFFADQEEAKFQFFKQVISLLQEEKRELEKAETVVPGANLVPYHLKLAEISTDGGAEQLDELFAQVLAPVWVLNAEQLCCSVACSDSTQSTPATQSNRWWDQLEHFFAKTPTQHCHLMVLAKSDSDQSFLKTELEARCKRWSQQYPHLDLEVEWLPLPLGLLTVKAKLQKFL